MYSLIIALIVQSHVILCSYGDSPPVFLIDLQTVNDITINEYESLHLSVHGIINDLRNDEQCSGRCEVNDKIVNLATCKQLRDRLQYAYLIVSIDTNITKEYDGEWRCNYNLTENPHKTATLDQNDTELEIKMTIKSNQNQNNNQNQLIQLNNKFKLNVKPHPVPEATAAPLQTVNWYYIGAGIGTLIILIFIGQTICIIHFKKKASANQREARMANRQEDRLEDRARYSRMPGEKIRESVAIEARESGLYEALDIKVVPPEPPSLQSLPRKKKTKPEESPVSTTPTRSGNIFAFNSLKKNKNKNDLILYDTESKTSTLEFVKDRPPLPLPTEEMYEALGSEEEEAPLSTPLPPRKDVKQKMPKIKNTKKNPLPEPDTSKIHETPAVPQWKSQPGLPISGMVGPKPGAVPTDFKEALEQRLRQNTLKSPETIPPLPKPVTKFPLPKPTRDKTVTPKHWANEPTIKDEPNIRTKEPIPSPTMEKPWLKTSRPMPKQRKPVPCEEPMSLKPNYRSPESSPYISKERPEISDIRPRFPPQDQLLNSGPNKLRPGRNPGLPPKDAPPVKVVTPWGEALPPKPKPPPPLKPNQQSPINQQPPNFETESMDVPIEYPNGENDDSDDEQWIYEDLPEFNVYSI